MTERVLCGTDCVCVARVGNVGREGLGTVGTDGVVASD